MGLQLSRDTVIHFFPGQTTNVTINVYVVGRCGILQIELRPLL